jgi:hypothetical protein
VSVAASATLLPGGREACPWPMLLPGTDGYRREFDFLDQASKLMGSLDLFWPGLSYLTCTCMACGPIRLTVKQGEE